jgi:hypothetical protein
MGRPHEINLKSSKYHFRIGRASLLLEALARYAKMALILGLKSSHVKEL